MILINSFKDLGTLEYSVVTIKKLEILKELYVLRSNKITCFISEASVLFL